MSGSEKKSPVALVLGLVVILLIVLVAIANTMLSSEGGRQAIQEVHNSVAAEQRLSGNSKQSAPSPVDSAELKGVPQEKEVLKQQSDVKFDGNSKTGFIDQEQSETDIFTALRSAQFDLADQLFDTFKARYPDAVLTSRYPRLKAYLMQKSED